MKTKLIYLLVILAMLLSACSITKPTGKNKINQPAASAGAAQSQPDVAIAGAVQGQPDAGGGEWVSHRQKKQRHAPVYTPSVRQ